MPATAPKIDDPATRQLTLAFAPIHKLALGMATGIVASLLLFVVTVGHLAFAPDQGEYLGLLGQYFYGYTITPAGAVVGLCWGFITGFVAGWFLAFVCNLTVTLTIFALRTKAELSQTRDFLDHI